MKSITHRWLINSLSVIVVILIALDIGFSAAISSYYYQSARQALETKANLVSSLAARIADDKNVDISAEIRSIVETFSDRDKMELMALDHDGEAVITSSGFSYLDSLEISDYSEAIRSETGKGYFVGNMGSGERVMAITVLLPVINSEFNAVRVMVSLQGVDSQIMMSIIVFTLICIFVLLCVVFSGLYFIRSIVTPVREVGIAANKIASGDLKVRVRKKRNDEIGELGDIINSMADELQTSNQIKNDFISSVSHELRTPLTAIKGWGETLIATPPEDTEMFRKGIQVILGETDRLSSMVEELLDFSRMENGRLSMVKTQMDLLAELGDAVLMYEPRAKTEGKEFIYQEPIALPFVFGDKNRLRQVFVNIIDNALKYTDKGDKICVCAEQKDGCVVIRVSDTGLGIAPEDLPHVTQKFYKANMTRRGSGIGLAVVDEIVTMHGGTLDIQSTYGVGTTVTITLPAMPETKSATAF